MSRAERILQCALAAILLLHAVGFLWWPGRWWGVSHLAAWPLAVGLAWLALALLGLGVVPRFADRLRRVPFPGGRVLLLIVAAAALCFVLLRESQHLFGDGWLLIRSRGMSVTFLRAPVLVSSIVWVVRSAEETLGIGIATGIAALSILAGLLAIVLMHRIARTLVDDSPQRWLAFGCLVTAGSMQLFFGHVEYYGVLAAGVLAWLWIALRESRGVGRVGVSWLAYAVLLTLHLSALGLLPAQVFLGWRSWRAGHRRALLASIGAAAALWWTLLRLARSGAQAVATQAGGGIHDYLAPYFDPHSSRHAFGFFDAAHALAVCNDLLLAAPIVFAVLVVVVAVRARRSHPSGAFLAIASAGCLGINILFNREIGAIRDWDTLAPYASVYLCWAVVQVSRRPVLQPQRAAVMLVWVAVAHAVPWTLMNAIPGAAERQIRILLEDESMWSPYARGLVHEEFAIVARQSGDLHTALREYEAASSASPSDARYHVGRGDTYYRLGDHAAAIKAYEAAIRVRPSWMPGHNNLAAVLLASGGDLSRARDEALEAVRLAPGNPEVWVTLGDIEMARHDADAAVRAFETALRLRPGSQRVAQRLQDARRTQQGSDP
jgi:predicted negative regulator of RcsB-dependent stress response